MWYLAKSTTKNEKANSGDLIILTSTVEAIDIIKKEDEELYRLKICLGHESHCYETHDSLEATKQSALALLNKIGGNPDENKTIIESFDIFAGKSKCDHDEAKKAFLKAILS